MPIYSFKEYRLLIELVKIGSEHEGNYVFQFEKWLYVIKPHDTKMIEEIIIKLNELTNLQLKYYQNFTIDKLIKIIVSKVIDCVVGKIEDNKLVILNKYQFSNYSSTLLNKIKKQLNVDGFVIPEDFKELETVNVDGVKIPDIGYHGTLSKFLPLILKEGIKPQSKNDWGFDLKNLIFFSTSKMQPIFHATRKFVFNENWLPMIIEFKIPDKDKIKQDFDMEQFSGKQDIYDIVGKKIAISNKPMFLSKEFGIFGYKGLILPQLITNIYLPDPDIVKVNKDNNEDPGQLYLKISDYKKFDKKDALKYLK